MGRTADPALERVFLMASRGMDLAAAWSKCGKPTTLGNASRHLGCCGNGTRRRARWGLKRTAGPSAARDGQRGSWGERRVLWECAGSAVRPRDGVRGFCRITHMNYALSAEFVRVIVTL